MAHNPLAQFRSKDAPKPGMADPIAKKPVDEPSAPAVDPMLDEIEEPVTCPKCGEEFVPTDPMEEEAIPAAPGDAPQEEKGGGYLSKIASK